jgi:prepilin-type N-terminal cleavage/methylation domain-containing protein
LRHRQYRNGFTLIEMLIVVVVMGILAAVVIPAFRSSHARSLESTARVLAGDLRLARSQAVQFDTEYTVQFDLAENSYTIVHSGAGSPPALKNPLAPAGQETGPYVVDLDSLGPLGAAGGDIRLAGAALKTSQQDVTDIEFGPLGGTGPARVEDTILWVITGTGDDTRCVRITVSWVTGQVWVDPPRMLPPGSESELFN